MWRRGLDKSEAARFMILGGPPKSGGRGPKCS